MEPNVVVHSALLSPNTGIADFGLVARKMALEINAHPNGEVKVQFEVRRMSRIDGSTGPVVKIEGAEMRQNGPMR